ncbi:hypothetical protein SAMN04487949_2921 [Halogranum gelatinilyticum]|uniref:Uncharacterized protein n=1 Tax=Halogranum gelatinilyticum TaxID=660521 RepID=A0A1G9XBI5_9EURY|nr:hypothetical protein [Halogranum gelatinilyticum]SDM94098.1 hypothetical protein SAMN04487949_2921 [Halogranum gelatinilyticum]
MMRMRNLTFDVALTAAAVGVAVVYVLATLLGIGSSTAVGSSSWASLLAVVGLVAIALLLGLRGKQLRTRLQETRSELETVHENLELDIRRPANARTLAARLSTRVEGDKIVRADEGVNDRWLQTLSKDVDHGNVAAIRTVVDELEEYGQNGHNHQRVVRSLEDTVDRIDDLESENHESERIAQLFSQLSENFDKSPATSSEAELEQAKESLKRQRAELGRKPVGTGDVESFLGSTETLLSQYIKHREQLSQQASRIEELGTKIGVETSKNSDKTLQQIISDVDDDRIGRRTALEAATRVSQEETLSAPEARRLCEVLSDPSESVEAVTETLRATAETLDEHRIVQGQLGAASSVEDIDRKVASLIEQCRAIDHYFGAEMAERLTRERDRLDEDMQLLQRYLVDTRVSLLEDVIGDFVGRVEDEETDVDKRHAACKQELEAYRDAYINGSRGERYNNRIPSHFANAISSLLSEAGRTREQGEQERAMGMTIAAEMMLSAIKSMYEDRRLQAQLNDLWKLRSPDYRLVEA